MKKKREKRKKEKRKWGQTVSEQSTIGNKVRF